MPKLIGIDGEAEGEMAALVDIKQTTGKTKARSGNKCSLLF